MTDGLITIRQGREKPIRNQHPWIFSGSITNAENAEPGAIVTVVDSRGKFLGRGYWNAKSQIQVRLLTWQDESIDNAWWRDRLQRAIASRRAQIGREKSACRLIHAENDFLPGLIVDKYDDYLVLQALTLHIDMQKEHIAKLLAEILEIKGVYERSDVEVRGKEGLSESTGVLWGDEPPEHIEIHENGTRILVDIVNGHKTGFYLDQATNRQLPAVLRDNIHGDCSILNLFSYTGGFALNAATGDNVHAVNVDSSFDALTLAERNYELNEFHLNKRGTTMEFIQADCFTYLRDSAQRNENFDMVVLDPPKFAHNKRQIDKASRGYKDLNLNAFKLIKPGGYLMTFSCSGAISQDLFQKIVFGALADSGRQAQIVRQLGAADDHPVALTFPEGDYLKGLLLRVY
ncbi:MAG: class I SAM-dependent rRNA methyltransferase [Aggregatilineales bacterium]